VPELLAHADVALNPRLDSPGIAQKTLNYMAMGLPIVSFLGSGRHLINGDTGLLVENGNIEGFADAIVRLLEDPELARRLGEHGKRTVRKKNDWAQSSALLERVIEQVVAGRAGKQMPSSQDVPAI
jgi:glycosyltransferase involved in cell wall biosynthesis